MRLLVISENLYGGVAVHTYQLVRAAVAAGDQVHIAFIRRRHRDDPMLELSKIPGVSYEVLGSGGGIPVRRAISAIHRVRPDVTLWPKGGPHNGHVLTDLAARSLSRTFVTVEHNMPPLSWPQGPPYLGIIPRMGLTWRWRVLRMQLRSHIPTRIIAVSDAVGSFLVKNGYPSGKVIVVPNGIDTEAHRKDLAVRESTRKKWGIENGVFLFGSVGRVAVIQKRIDLLLEAFSLLLQQKPAQPPYLAIIGDGPDLPAMRQRAAQLGIAQRVIFAGSVSFPVKEMSALDALVNTSDYEGLCYSILEAMAMELPCIATAVGGAERLLSGTGAGWLVNAGDARGIAAAMLSATGLNAEARSVMGERARRVVVAGFREADRAVELHQLLLEASRPLVLRAGGSR